MTDLDAGGQGAGSQQANTPSSPKEMIGDAAQTVKKEAASFAADAKEKATEQLSQHKDTATQTLGDFANAIRKAGDELSQGDQSMAGRVVRQAADGLEGFARSVSDKRPEELLEAVRDFGRRNPTAFIAASVLAGVALGRFMKSSSASAESSQGQTTSSGGAAGVMGGSYGSGANVPDEVTAAGATSIGAPNDTETMPPPEQLDEDAAGLGSDPMTRDRFSSEL